MFAGSTLVGPGTIHGHNLPTYDVIIAEANCVVAGVTFRNPKNWAINVAASDCVIRDSTFIDVPASALLAGASAHRTRFTGNRVSTARAGNGVLFAGGNVGCVVANNVIDVRGTTGIELIQGCARTTITRNTVVGPAIGISLDAAVDCTATGNTVQDSSYANVELAQACSRCTVSGNTLTNGAIGIIDSPRADGTPGQQNTITANTINGAATHGIRVLSSRGVTITSNTLENCGDRYILLESTGSSVVSGNTIRMAGGADKAGVHLLNCTYVTVGSNNIDCQDQAGSMDGIYATGCSTIAYTGNLIRSALAGIRIIGGVEHLVVGNLTAGSSDRAFSSDAAKTLVVGHLGTVAGGSFSTTSGTSSAVRDSLNGTTLVG